MDLWNVDKLLLFIAFVIPGFCLLKTNAVLGLEPIADSSKQVVDAIAYQPSTGEQKPVHLPPKRL